MNGLLKRICKLVLVEGKEERIARTHTTPQTSAENPAFLIGSKPRPRTALTAFLQTPYGHCSCGLLLSMIWHYSAGSCVAAGRRNPTLGLLIYSCWVKMGKGGKVQQRIKWRPQAITIDDQRCRLISESWYLHRILDSRHHLHPRTCIVLLASTIQWKS